MYYHFKITPEEIGYSAECLEFEGCHTQGDTMEELEKNMEEALNLCLDESVDSDTMFPYPFEKSPKGSVKVAVDPEIIKAMLARQK